MKAILKVINKNGIHARPSAGIVEVVKKYKSKVTFFHDGEKANAGSIMELLYLAIGPDEEVEVVAEGEDEEKVIAELDGLFKKGVLRMLLNILGKTLRSLIFLFLLLLSFIIVFPISVIIIFVFIIWFSWDIAFNDGNQAFKGFGF